MTTGPGAARRPFLHIQDNEFKSCKRSRPLREQGTENLPGAVRSRTMGRTSHPDRTALFFPHSTIPRAPGCVRTPGGIFIFLPVQGAFPHGAGKDGKMKKTYLVRKDAGKEAGEGNWMIMNAYEFARFMETEEGRRRKDGFCRLDGACAEDGTIYIECWRAKAAEIRKESNHAAYLRKLEQEGGQAAIPYGAETEEGRTEERADGTMDTEEMALAGILEEELPEALGCLDAGERALILALYAGDGKMTESRYAEEHGTTRWQIRERHKRALRKLRLHYRRKKLL